METRIRVCGEDDDWHPPVRFELVDQGGGASGAKVCAVEVREGEAKVVEAAVRSPSAGRSKQQTHADGRSHDKAATEITEWIVALQEFSPARSTASDAKSCRPRHPGVRR